MSKNVNFQMANANDPEEIIHATQISVLEGLQSVIQDLRDSEELKGQGGLTWQQLEITLEAYKKKKPKIIFQDGAQ